MEAQIGTSAGSDPEVITPTQIEERLRACKKPKGLLRGDLFPDLVSTYATHLSAPLEKIFNCSLRTETWPDLWKIEYVTAIPKNSSPSSFNELRNMSCTCLFSKVFEFFVLERLKKEVTPSPNQYGGLPGLSTSHYLLDAWNNILEALDQNDAAVNLISLDFAKAFNSMGHQACLESLRHAGATPHTISMVGAFLLNRQTTTRVGEAFSSLRPVRAGSPQGTLLGNYLFIMTTDRLKSSDSEPDPATLQPTCWSPPQEAYASNGSPSPIAASSPAHPTRPPDLREASPDARTAVRPDVHLALPPDSPGAAPYQQADFLSGANAPRPNDSGSSSDSSFVYLSGGGQPINQINDTGTDLDDSIRTLDGLQMLAQNPPPSNLVP